MDESLANVQDSLAENLQTSNVDCGVNDSHTTISLNFDSSTNTDTTEVNAAVCTDLEELKCSESLSDNMKNVDLTEKNTTESSLSTNSEEKVSTLADDDENEGTKNACYKDNTREGDVMECSPTGNILSISWIV